MTHTTYDGITDASEAYTIFPDGLKERFRKLEQKGKRSIEAIWAYEEIRDELQTRNNQKYHGKVTEQIIDTVSKQWAAKYGRSEQFTEQGYIKTLEAAVSSFQEIADVLSEQNDTTQEPLYGLPEPTPRV